MELIGYILLTFAIIVAYGINVMYVLFYFKHTIDSFSNHDVNTAKCSDMLVISIISLLVSCVILFWSGFWYIQIAFVVVICILLIANIKKKHIQANWDNWNLHKKRFWMYYLLMLICTIMGFSLIYLI